MAAADGSIRSYSDARRDADACTCDTHSSDFRTYAAGTGRPCRNTHTDPTGRSGYSDRSEASPGSGADSCYASEARPASDPRTRAPAGRSRDSRSDPEACCAGPASRDASFEASFPSTRSGDTSGCSASDRSGHPEARSCARSDADRPAGRNAEAAGTDDADLAADVDTDQPGRSAGSDAERQR